MIREVSLVSKEMISLKNILLITGASVIQSGAVLEHMIGEALQSHQLKWSVKHFQGSRNNFIGKCCSLQESTPSKCLATKVAILFSLILLDRLQVFFIRSPSTELLSHFNIRFVLLKESATNHSYFKVLFIVATKIYGKALCFFSSGARVKDLEVEVEALVIQGPKLETILSQVKKLEASVLVVPQKKPSLFGCFCGTSSSEQLVEQCISHADCFTIGVRKQSNGMGGYLINTRWQKNFWLLA
ncbi:uncharacterized protein LOC111797679 isoform X1 [Cucurbita pepo subsp. pepo]|uniref:uncharacterized protein LOC111797679 isoform X1 n=3 Tax=Cucurbita pepo subsp. pepo TaxID=3664 RepID=UPI000C9D719B|nr:uncharacterized protein LOC111797679 isoform X1 [Cucurbita pepo subsp. pepo]XP_023536531.1 uncharacterized protein LOC111797679 isoform X1 [Cucurbita pepo subsp. pepo]